MHAPCGAAWPSPRLASCTVRCGICTGKAALVMEKSRHVNSDDHSLQPVRSTCTEYSAYDRPSTNLFVDETRSGRRDVEEVYIRLLY